MTRRFPLPARRRFGYPFGNFAGRGFSIRRAARRAIAMKARMHCAGPVHATKKASDTATTFRSHPMAAGIDDQAHQQARRLRAHRQTSAPADWPRACPARSAKAPNRGWLRAGQGRLCLGEGFRLDRSGSAASDRVPRGRNVNRRPTVRRVNHVTEVVGVARLPHRNAATRQQLRLVMNYDTPNLAATVVCLSACLDQHVFVC